MAEGASSSNDVQTPVLGETITLPTKYGFLMFNLIDIVSKRGAIHSNEFTVIGEFVDILAKELNIKMPEKNPTPPPDGKDMPTIPENA